MSDDVQQPDPRPGFYYVSVVDGPRKALAFGPFANDHAAALADVDRVRRLAEERDPRAAFYAFGTCRSETALGPGVLGSPSVAHPPLLWSGVFWAEAKRIAAAHNFQITVGNHKDHYRLRPTTGRGVKRKACLAALLTLSTTRWIS